MKEFKLNFRGPFSLCGEESIFWESPLADQRGIYLWTIQYQKEYYVDYIGETGKSFYDRNKEHIIQLLGGNYRLLDIDSLHDRGTVENAWEGFIRKKEKQHILGLLNSYMEIAPKIIKYIEEIKVFVAAFESEQSERRLIEGTLARFIREQGESVNRFFPRDIRYYRRKTGKETLVVNFHSPYPIAGIPGKLII